MSAIVMFYAGVITSIGGVITVIRPWRWLGMTRPTGAIILCGGIILSVAGALWPASSHRVGVARSRLDEFAPEYQFHEFHQARVAAPCATVYQAIRKVTAREIRFFDSLIWIRRLGRPLPESILRAPQDEPLLDVATRTTFLKLAEEPQREIVVGTVVVRPPGGPTAHQLSPSQYKQLRGADFAVATMNFLVAEDAPGSCRVTTETRVFATSNRARRQFAAYWRVIYPGSALIRRMWLRAIKLRAES